MNKKPVSTLEGRLEHITYHNADNHYTIAKLSIPKTSSRVTIVGTMAAVNPGESLSVEGYWEHHPRFGQQFRIHTYSIHLPDSADGIRNYLKSGFIKGIGPAMAKRMVNHFTTDTIEIIEHNPERLQEVPGIGPVKADAIVKAWNTHHGLRNLMRFLQENNIQASCSGRIFKEYGCEAVEILKSDPYRVAGDIPGVGFIVADTIARNLNLSLDTPERIQACLIYILEQFAADGHTFAPLEDLLERCDSLFQIQPGEVPPILEMLAESREIVINTGPSGTDMKMIYLKHLHEAETGIAAKLKALLSIPVMPPDLEPEEITAKILEKLAIQLSGEQMKVLDGILAHRAAIITGGPGTGKTTLIRSIGAIFGTLGKRIIMAAPTGRAARRLSEVTGRKAATIHRLLGFNLSSGYFEKDRNDPLDADVLIIDEVSMVDTPLMFHLMDALPMQCVLIMVGDVFQLPSVGPGNVLSDLIKSEVLPVFYLNEVFRQARESAIIMNAHRIRKGDPPLFERPDESGDLSEFYFIEQRDTAKVVDTIVELCCRAIPQKFFLDPMQDIQVITPMHKGAMGTINLNQVLQKKLNPLPDGAEKIQRFKTGDKVMHLKNNYVKDVFNGDIGRVAAIDKNEETLTVDYEGRSVPYDFAELDELTLAYAITIHKSQGSEYPAVIVPVTTRHFIMLQRNLIYTAATRGRKLVILIGTRKALAIALKNNKPRQRLSFLARRLSMTVS